MSKELKGKRIKEGNAGGSPHKFAFYGMPPERYATVLSGKTGGRAERKGPMIVVSLEPDRVLGEGGERILFHPSADTLPKKHQL